MNNTYEKHEEENLSFSSKVNHWRLGGCRSNSSRQVSALPDRRHNNNKQQNANNRSMEKNREVDAI